MIPEAERESQRNDSGRCQRGRFGVDYLSLNKNGLGATNTQAVQSYLKNGLSCGKDKHQTTNTSLYLSFPARRIPPDAYRRIARGFSEPLPQTDRKRKTREFLLRQD